jgi:hypothetical protein
MSMCRLMPSISKMAEILQATVLSQSKTIRPPTSFEREQERINDYDQFQHHLLHQSGIILHKTYGTILSEFVKSIDPLKQFHMLKIINSTH